MKNKILTVLAIILGVLPVYEILAWIYVFNNNLAASHEEKQIIFNDQMFFGIVFFKTIQSHVLTALLGLISVTIFSVLIYYNNLNTISTLKTKRINFFTYLFFLIIYSFFTLLCVFGLM
jgi:hypothetical protein